MCFKSWFEALDLGTENTELGNGNYLETALEEEIAISSHDVLNSLKEDSIFYSFIYTIVSYT